MVWCFFFFFSSRRRHTRFSRDWSSDVCSSDLVEGRERFRLVELTEGRAFATAEVADLDDDGEEPTEDEVAQCLAAYDRVVKAAEADLEELDLDAESIAFQIAARVDFGTEVKQGLLELQSERQRVLRLELEEALLHLGAE